MNNRKELRVDNNVSREQIERLAVGLSLQHPELFGVNQVMDSSSLTTISAGTDLVFEDGTIQLNVSITKHKESGEIIQEIRLNDGEEAIYRLDVSSGSQTNKEKERMELTESIDDSMRDSIARMINGMFGSDGGVTVSRLDNYAETKIKRSEAKAIIESGELRLPRDSRITLLELKQKMGGNFPLLG